MVRKWLVAAVFVLAQWLSAQAVPQEQPRGDMFIGYAYAKADVGSNTHYGLQGFEWSNDHSVRPWLAI